MCGIAGIIDPTGVLDDLAGRVSAMVDSLRHRGPDERGTHVEPGVGLGHARLSIIDLGSGRQPLANEDESVWVTFNGEIYNFNELRLELERKGHRFRTHSDTEAIVHQYEEVGEDCVQRFRGMFAFGIWDRRNQSVLLARDRLGKKPLYLAQVGDSLVFASEIKALLTVPGLSREIDVTALLDFLTFGWIPAPKTIFRAVRKLPAGHLAVFKKGNLRIREYWDLEDDSPFTTSEPSLVEEFRDRLTEAVRLRLVSDVPLGAFLSGGLDSSAVVATMARLSARPVITNSVGFNEAAFNELEHADKVAKQFHTEHHRQIVQADAAKMVDLLSWHWDEPFADSSAVPTYCVSKMARENVTVAMSGDGGDENLAGYRRYKFGQRQRLVRQSLPSFLRRQVFGTLAAIYPKADRLPRFLRAKSTFQELSDTDEMAICRARSLLQPEISRRLLNADVCKELADYHSCTVIEHHYRKCRFSDPLNRELYVDIKTYLVDDILTKVDRASMAVGLEVRAPLLDHKMVEFMAKVPSNLKLRGGTGKYLFKQAFRPILGEAIVDRSKMGFAVPLNQWLRGPLCGLVEESLFGSDSYVQNWLDMVQTRRHWTDLRNGRAHHESLIWAVFMLEQWARRFMAK